MSKHNFATTDMLCFLFSLFCSFFFPLVQFFIFLFLLLKVYEKQNKFQTGLKIFNQINLHQKKHWYVGWKFQTTRMLQGDVTAKAYFHNKASCFVLEFFRYDCTFSHYMFAG